MDGILGTVLAYTTIPVVGALLGSLATVVRTPSGAVRRAAMHLAAGVILATAALELLPDVTEGQPWAIVAGFGLGMVAMLGLRTVSRRLERAGGAESGWPTGTLAAVGVDHLVDGLVLGIGFAAAVKVGVVLTAAMAVEYVIIAVTLSAMMAERGVARVWVVSIPTALSALTMVGAAAGTTIFSGMSVQQLTPVLAFAAASLLFLVTEDLLAESHQEGESSLLTGMFFIGFLLFLVITTLTSG